VHSHPADVVNGGGSAPLTTPFLVPSGSGKMLHPGPLGAQRCCTQVLLALKDAASRSPWLWMEGYCTLVLVPKPAVPSTLFGSVKMPYSHQYTISGALWLWKAPAPRFSLALVPDAAEPPAHQLRFLWLWEDAELPVLQLTLRVSTNVMSVALGKRH
jgi:hypothetical protein